MTKPLLAYVQAIGTLFQEIEFYVRTGPKGETQYGILFNPVAIPDKDLPWLAQFAGVRLNKGLTPAQQRALIVQRTGMQRGTPLAMINALSTVLTGTKSVIFRERDGDPYTLTVITRTAETPDPAAARTALLRQKPAGIILNYQVLTGQDYGTLLANHPLYSNVYSTYVTYQGLLNDVPGT